MAVSGSTTREGAVSSSSLRRLRVLTGGFRFLFTAAAMLSVAASLLVTASLFIADRAPRSAEFLVISLLVSAAFLALGLLLAGMLVQVAGIARMASDEPTTAALLGRRVARLLMLLAVAGLGLCGLLAVVVYAILARIDQGFAVFG